MLPDVIGPLHSRPPSSLTPLVWIYFASRPGVLIRVEVVAVLLHDREFEATSETRRYRSVEHEPEQRRAEAGGGAIEPR